LKHYLYLSSYLFEYKYSFTGLHLLCKARLLHSLSTPHCSWKFNSEVLVNPSTASFPPKTHVTAEGAANSWLEAEKYWPELDRRRKQEHLDFSYYDTTVTETSKNRMSLEHVKVGI